MFPAWNVLRLVQVRCWGAAGLIRAFWHCKPRGTERKVAVLEGRTKETVPKPTLSLPLILVA